MMIEIISTWIFFGYFFSWIAIWIFRKENAKELILATLGPLFGLIVGVLIVNDLINDIRK